MYSLSFETEKLGFVQTVLVDFFFFIVIQKEFLFFLGYNVFIKIPTKKFSNISVLTH